MKPWVKNVIIFIVGLLLGVAATGIYIHHCFTRAWVNGGNHQHLVDRLSADLGLNPDQKTKIGDIYDAEIPHMDSIRQETNLKLKTLRDSTSAKIRLLLDADQQKKFDALKAKWDARENKNDKGWHIPGLPPGPSPNFAGRPTCCATPEKP